LLSWLALCGHGVLLAQQPSEQPQIVLRVVDETGVAVTAAVITVDSGGKPTVTVGTDELGRAVLPGNMAGRARLRVQKKDFYAFEQEVDFEPGREVGNPPEP